MQLLVAGGGRWNAGERETIVALGLEGRVLLLPRVEEAHLGELYRGAALFVYPSLHEGFGLPPLEAMSARCPVLVSCSSALPEVCGEAAHYFDPGDEGALERELGRLLGDTDSLRAKVDAGRAWVGRYTWETSAQGTLKAYREALDRAHERTAAGSACGVSGLKY
jgi:glycosyltransferase involved in cell wall biosynthesis